MPINNWNWYRAVGTGNDHKTWLGENPQVERRFFLLFLKLFFRLMMDEMEVILALRMVTEVNMRMSAVT